MVNQFMANLLVPTTEISFDTPKRDKFLKEQFQNTSKEFILGKGSYGTVIKGVYKGQQVAVKVINGSKDIVGKTVRNESNIVNWKHDNIIRVLKVVSGPKHGIVIMERFPGQCLQYIIDETHINVFHRLCIILDILNALSYCHERKLVHADVKPQNVMVAFSSNEVSQASSRYSRNYKCKLCDFGSSSFEGSGHRIKVGTIRYMSPEVLKGEGASCRSDIYSLGITMWQLEAGELPYSSIESNDIVVYRVVKHCLRPDCTEVTSCCPRKFLTPSKHKNCLCTHFGSEVSNNSVEEIEKIFESPSKNKIRLSSTSNIFRQRNALLNVCDNLKVNSVSPKAVRDLTFSKIDHNNNKSPNKHSIVIKVSDCCTDTASIRIPSTNCEAFSIRSIFGSLQLDTSSDAKIDAENQYKILYKTCWRQEAPERPNADTLKENALKILEKL